jgi:hypothetical protein
MAVTTQPEVNVYETSAVPAAMLATTPVDEPSVILVLVVDHTPPADPLCNTTPDPTHIDIVPYIPVAVLTVTTFVAIHPDPASAV